MTKPGRPRVERRCRLCGTVVPARERVHGDVCDSLDCRRAAVDEARAAERAADLTVRRRAAARAWDTPAPGLAPVIWLKPFEARLVPLRAAERRAHAAHLQTLAASAPNAADTTPRADPTPGPEFAGRVCAFCAGRCCEFGAHTHAFIERTQLVRWVADHPGSSLADAAQAYADHAPRSHVEESCVYHAREGCVLPRAMRADICNRYRCDALDEAQARAAADGDTGVVLAVPEVSRLRRAAWANDTALRPLLRRPRRAPTR